MGESCLSCLFQVVGDFLHDYQASHLIIGKEKTQKKNR